MSLREEFQQICRQVQQGESARRTIQIGQDTYIRNFHAKERLIVLGGGHISQPVCRYGSELGFSVTVVDDRPSFANHQRFPEADAVLCDAFAPAIARLSVTARDYVVIVTRGHRYDADCLRTLLPGTFPRYLGMIGSRRRVAALCNLLQTEGFDRALLDRIHAPIGMDIGAETVNEIGVSIAAELVACRRQSQPRRPHGSVLIRDEIDLPLLETLANDPAPRALLTVYETSGSTPVHSGAMMCIDRSLRTVGTIGGGCGESAVLREAVGLIGTGQTRCRTIEMNNDVAEDAGMVCGGRMSVLIEDFS